MLVFAKYDWYRPHFLYPVYGASAMGLAALVDWLVPQRVPQIRLPAPALPRGAWALAAAILVVASSVVVKATHARDASLLSTHLEQAKVFLDDVPCDYFNPQNERWECSHHDRQGWNMTGRLLGDEVTVAGVPTHGLLMHPHSSKKTRRLVFPALDASQVALSFVLGDATRPGPVDIEVRSRGAVVERFTLDGKGASRTLDVPLGDGEGDALEVRVRSDAPNWKHLVLEGRLSR